ncbi:Uu.00g062240.m01.CDS01 [Anthostomella pinea]|uniref:nitric oxide dioxygenase n=1 Tax=Anthostomella pinea TaxID=933095 RepID=A0AAI8VT65_9PEZI|nr:Uu.00g062240.m01.CDS01 [Anthostomella pinea]
MAASLTAPQIAVVKATAPVLKEHGTTITTLFYRNMIDAHPELHDYFNMTDQITGAQPRALAAAVFAYATYVDDLAQLTALVERIAHKHASLGIKPEHYPIVGKFLLEAWTAAYACLADIFINREQQLYAAFENWTGWRRFKIQRKEVESTEITSFYLVPEDGGALPLYLPGQYISLRMFISQLKHWQPRQYSLSDAPSTDYYRISVKREKGKEIGLPGLISNKLHEEYKEGDVVELTHPTGEFFVDLEDKTPLVLISAGVGITPMISILNSVVATGSSRQVSLIHGAHSSEARAFGEHIKEACNSPNIDATVFLTTTHAQEVQGVDYHMEGRMRLELVSPASLHLGDTTAHYYVCGPCAFMKDIRNYLLASGISEARIHLEVFDVGNE